MRRLAIALSVFILLLAGIAGLAWINRIPLAEWAIDTYQPETLLGPISVRISDISLSTVSVSEIRARYRGPVTIQDVTIDFAIGKGPRIILPAIRIGSLNAALSFADWFDLLDTIAPDGSDDGQDGLPTVPVTVGQITVETIDFYVETPKGYALLNGRLAANGPIDLSEPSAVQRLLQGLQGDLLLSAGAAGFPVESGAMGGGSLVVNAIFAAGSATLEAITPVRLNLEVSEPLPGLPDLPVGVYRADIGSDALPFKLTLGYETAPVPALKKIQVAPFPFALDTPFGTAEAEATTTPTTVTEAQTDPTALPLVLKGRLDLKQVPLPAGIKADITGRFEVDKGARTSIALKQGFAVSADMSASPLLSDVPPDALAVLGKVASFRTDSKMAIDIAAGNEGRTITGDGAFSVRSGDVTLTVPDGFDLEMTPRQDMEIAAKTVDILISPGNAPIAGKAGFGELAARIGPDGAGRARAGYRLDTDLLQSKGFLALQFAGDRLGIAVTDAAMSLPGTDMSIPSFQATATLADDGIDLAATVEEVLLGELRALKRPLSLTGTAIPAGWGYDFNAVGSIDDIVAISAKGTYAGGDVVMTFGSGDIPLGPGGADLSELTDLVDLGRSDPNGSIRVEGELTYQHGGISGYADLHIAEIGSVLADDTEISVLGTVTFDLSKPPATLEPATLTGSLSSDILGTIPFKETFTIRETGEMEVTSLEAQFLGGTITIREGLASASAGSLTGRVHAAAIDMNALADLMAIEGLEGTGRLTGDLKFHVTGDAIIIEAGELRADKPGILRYQGEALRAAASGNENLALLVQALENFHYEVLTLGIDIPEFGEGIVTLHLEGSNPDVLEGYPFDVTINLESEYGRLIREFLELYQEMDVILQGAVR
ncbi:intermembrane phospholipid transport protein YdbH family protein [Hwanghaeella sp.]|uniref:intermembrane phospholipid transport protein YdbH family protein n=1 Tax=Hwanghaeella sp. TaxID=2605943 RepID=UPI003CCBA724